MSNNIKKQIFVEAHALTKAYREVAVREGYAFDYRVTLSVYLKELYKKYKNGGDNTVALKSFNGETVLKADAGNIKIVFDCSTKQLKDTVAFKMADAIFFWDLNKNIIFSQENKLTEDKRELFTNALASVGYKPELEKDGTVNNNANTKDVTANTTSNNALNIIAVETELSKTTVTVDNKYNVELYKAAGTVGLLCNFNNKKYYFNIIERKVFLDGKLQNEKCHKFFNKTLAAAGYKLKDVDAKYSNVIINKCIKYKNKNVLIQKDKDSDIIKFIVDKNVRMIRLGESFTFCGARIYSKEDYNFLIKSLRTAGYNMITTNTNTNSNTNTNNTFNANNTTNNNTNPTTNSISNIIISQTIVYNNYTVRIKKLKDDNNITFIFKDRLYNLNLSENFITCNNKVQNTKCYEFFVGALKSIGYDVTDNNTNNSATTNATNSNANTNNNNTTNTTNTNDSTNNNNTNTKKPRKPRKICIDSNEYMQMQFQI